MAGLLMLSIVPSASAAQRTTAGPGDARLDNGGNCNVGSSGQFNAWQFWGHTSSSPSTSRSGVKATLWRDAASTGFRMCHEGILDNVGNGVMTFVEIYPRNDSGYCDGGAVNDTCYIRIGIAECDGANYPDPIFAYCDDSENNQERIFVEMDGCGYSKQAWDFGVPDGNGTEVYVYMDSAFGTWRFFADGQSLMTASSSTSTRLSCWIGGVGGLGAAYMFRNLDWQDSIGTEVTAGTRQTDVQYGVLNQGWFYPAWGDGNCQFPGTPIIQNPGTCWRYAGSSLYTYTDD